MNNRINTGIYEVSVSLFGASEASFPAAAVIVLAAEVNVLVAAGLGSVAADNVLASEVADAFLSRAGSS